MAEDRSIEDFDYDADETEGMDDADEVGDVDGVEPHRIEPATVPPDDGDAESEDAQRAAGEAPADEAPSAEAPPESAADAQTRAAGGVSGLTATQRLKARELAVRAAMLGLRRAESLHYTQGGRRWEGIDRDLKAWRAACPNWADCSSFATWCLWNGLSHYRVRDVVNGANWKAGFTGTMSTRGARVTHPRNVLRGDLVLYGNPFGPDGHVAIVVGHRAGKIEVVSFGSEAGPFLLAFDYKPVTMIRRYV